MAGRALSAFLIAVEFLTVIPVRGPRDYSPRTVGLSLIWFPIVGLLIGCALVAVDRLASAVTTPMVTVALVLTANAVLTGALHLDGLADTADGVFGGHTPERRLEIMKDSRIGAFGVVALILAMLVQYSALVSLSTPVRHSALLLAPALSRLGMIVALVAYPYARPSGFGRTLREQAPRYAVGVAAVIAAAIAGMIDGFPAVAYLLFTALLAWLSGWYLTRRLGGLTGDSYGAIVVLTEVLILVLISSKLPARWFG